VIEELRAEAVVELHHLAGLKAETRGETVGLCSTGAEPRMGARKEKVMHSVDRDSLPSPGIGTKSDSACGETTPALGRTGRVAPALRKKCQPCEPEGPQDLTVRL
jgi:hypothetical protein